MANLRFELNRSGVRALLRGDAAKELCTEYARDAAARLGEGYAYDNYTGANRANAMVYAKTAAAIRDAQENDTIRKALK